MSIPSDLAARIRTATRTLADDAAAELHTFRPAVMVPVDAAADASRIEAVRLKVADVLQEVREEETDLDRRVNQALNVLREDDALMEAITAIMAIAFDAQRQAEITASKATSQADASVVADVVDKAVTELNLVAGEVSALPAMGMASRQLKVTGASGVSKEIALQSWMDKRHKIARAWSKMVKAQSDVKIDRIGLNERPHTTDQAKQKRLTINDNEELAEAMLLEIYSEHYGVGDEVAKDKESYSPFPLPKTLDSLNYDRFKKEIKTWMSSPATVKKYHLVLHDIDYSCDAVDAVKAMHLLAPDTDPTWHDPSAFCGSKEFKDAKAVQWRRLHKELSDQATETVKTWMDRMHSVGQDADTLIEIEIGDGQSFVYAMLSEHVEFTANDQQHHTTLLMKLHDVFNKPANPIQAVEQARLKLRKAREVGVHPEYDLGGQRCHCGNG